MVKWKDKRLLITGLTTILALGSIIHFHLILGVTLVFTHFFYVPILLSTYWYGRRGMIVPILLIIALMISNLISFDFEAFIEDVARSSIMLLVGFVMSRVSERDKEHIRRLEENEQTLKEAQRIGQIGNWEWNIKDNSLKWSEEVYRIFGVEQSDFVPTYDNYFLMVPEEERERIRSAITRSLKNGSVLEIDHKILLKQGAMKVVHQRGEVVLDKDGRPLKMMGIVQDITERMKIEDKLRMANKKLSLITSISRHDLKNMITSISGYLDLGLRAEKEEKRRLYLEKAILNLKNLQDLIDEAKDFQDIGIREPEWIEVRKILEKFRPKVEETGRLFDNRVDELFVFCDPSLERILFNLVDNSLRHAKNASFIRFSVALKENGIVLICEDDGPGVVFEDKEEIFKKGVGKNTGLGLFFVKEALKECDMTVVENGDYGKGARFEIFIPSYKVRYKKSN
ncbi:MAG: PAS domain-containing protein [Methanomassiliicoccales archaeon]|nr:MAG: PAS domain-containing protein [Methanomassiliicoccales archaeon]